MDVRRRTQIGGLKKTSSGGDDVIPEPIINVDNYLTIEALEDGLTASLSTNACEYCVDGDGNWKTLSAGNATQSINSGHTLSFRGNITPVKNVGIGTFTISKKCNLSGKCASMLYGDGAADNYSISSKAYAFYMLFTNNNTIIDASQLELPTDTSNYCYNAMFYQCRNLIGAPTLGTSTSLGCYNSMFRECDRLVVPPALPATVAASGCYKRMFQDCPSLLEAPELPARGINEQCYQYMFSGCTSLTTAPELPAVALARHCYQYMFDGCTKLNYIKMLATDISASNCLNSWVSGVASTGTFVKNPAMTTLPTGVHGIPSGWTVVNDGEESGGKIVNHLRKGKTSTTMQYLTLDFPAETNLLVYYTFSQAGSGSSIFQKGSSTISIGLGPGESVVSVDRLDPNEDDVYIYKIDYE